MGLFQVNVSYLIVRHVSYWKQSTKFNKLEIILAAVALFVVKLVHAHILLLYFFRSIIERVWCVLNSLPDNNVIVFAMQLPRMPQHPPKHDDDWLNRIRNVRQWYQGCDVLWAILGVMLCKCSRTRNRDNPFDRHGIRLLGNSRQRICCGLRAEGQLS